MASVRSAWGLVQSEVCSSLIPIFLLGHTNGITVLHALWEVNKEEVVKAMVELYLKDAAHIPRILDVCQVLQPVEYSLIYTLTTVLLEHKVSRIFLCISLLMMHLGCMYSFLVFKPT